MTEEEKINMSIIDGDAFFAHEVSINFNPMQFIVDFKNITPRVDPRSQSKPSLALRHNVIMLEPYHVKQLYNLLGDVIKKYETEYAKIEKSESMKKFEKKHKKDINEKKKHKTQAPTYFG